MTNDKQDLQIGDKIRIPFAGKWIRATVIEKQGDIVLIKHTYGREELNSTWVYRTNRK